jgi:hypothetical protein
LIENLTRTNFKTGFLWLFIKKSTIHNSVLVGQHLIQQLPQYGTAAAVRNESAPPQPVRRARQPYMVVLPSTVFLSHSSRIRGASLAV